MTTIRDAMAKAEMQAQRAGRVLAGLRDFLYRGETNLASLSVAEILGSVGALAKGEAERAGVAIEIRDETRNGRVMADRIQIEQAMLNLIRNSVEALSETAVGPRRLEIVARSRNDQIEIDFADTGPGVPAELMERLFQPFATSKSHGMGLGLTISRSIVEAHGGRLWYLPRDGGGSVFRITLPNGDGYAG
jgi:two-component system sensor kinase FixL